MDCKKILEHYKNPRVELNFSTPFELLIAAMLSARYTDKKTNFVEGWVFYCVFYRKGYFLITCNRL
jgi:endonuclease III